MRVVWSVDDIKLYLTNLFIYYRDFARVASFLLSKSVKDVIDFFYLTKKFFELSKYENIIWTTIGSRS